MKKIVVINPGATSTKIAYFEDTEQIWKDEVTYTSEEISKYSKVFDQFEMRAKDIKVCLEKHSVEKDLDTVVGRGGLVGPVKPGAILVDEALIERLEHRPVLEHASNLGCKLSQFIIGIFGKEGTNAYIYDPVTVDSMSDVARITGLKNVQRQSVGHHLNMRAVAMKAAEDLKKTYETANIIVVHMGGGSSASAHQEGQVVDFVSDDEIMFSAERSGGIAIKQILPMIKEMGVDAFNTLVRKEAGLQSHFGTKDLREIEAKIAAANGEGKIVIEALALGISKCMAALAATMSGKVDAVCLTGGMAHSQILREEVEKRTGFIAPFMPYPGEFEMIALAKGGLRVIEGKEQAHLISDMLD